ncbi:MAG: O-antigen ligase family protein [Candidatus Hydrogenedentes bacterium]|nr:O-antigen ligase family protein [Candidatus Hydrogenedentota bacterium]
MLMGVAWAGLTVFLALYILFFGLLNLPAPALIALPLAALFGLLLLAHTPSGLMFTAFAIGPLGIVQAELASVTVNLPEALILALAAKELLPRVLRGTLGDIEVPWRGIVLYLAVAGAILVYAFVKGNPPVAALQDCRQFTEYALLYVLIVAAVKEERQIRHIALAFLAGVLVLALHGIVQRFTGIGIPGNQMVSDAVFHESVRSGSFYGSTPLGALMVLGLGPALGLMMSTGWRVNQGILLLVAAALITAAVFTNTRASWLAIALLLAVVFLGVRKSVPFVAVTVAGMIVFTVILGPIVAKRMQTLEISKSESSLLERVQYYTTAMHIFKHRPVTGLGWGRYFDENLILLNERYIPANLPNLPVHMKAPEATVHSAYLQLLVKGGIVTLGAFLVLMYLCARGAWRAYRQGSGNPGRYHLFLGLSASVLGYLFHASLENFFQWPVMSQAFWLLAGLITVSANLILREDEARTSEAGVPALPGHA